jgi:hypothetical protein
MGWGYITASIYEDRVQCLAVHGAVPPDLVSFLDEKRVARSGTEGKQGIFEFAVIYSNFLYRCKRPGEVSSANRIGDRTSVNECLPERDLVESPQKRR